MTPQATQQCWLGGWVGGWEGEWVTPPRRWLLVGWAVRPGGWGGAPGNVGSAVFALPEAPVQAGQGGMLSYPCWLLHFVCGDDADAGMWDLCPEFFHV